MQKALVAAMLLISMNTYAQVEITLTKPQTILTNAPFFVKDVLDQRADKNSIGTFQKEDSTIILILKSGVRNSFIRFSDQAIASEENQKPLILTIRTLELTANQNKDGATARLDIVVSEFVDSGSWELLTISQQLDTIGLELNRDLWGHMLNRIFSQVLLSVKQFYDIPEIERTKPVFFKAPEIQPALVTHNEKPCFKRVKIIGTTFTFSKIGSGFGFTFRHFRDFEDGDNWLMAGLYAIESWKYEGLVVGSQNEQQVTQGMWLKCGVQPMYRLGKGFYFCLPMQFPVGVVQEEFYKNSYYGPTETRTTMLIGLNFGQGLCFFPRSKYGWYLGVRAYEQFLLQQKEFGVAADFGIKF